MNTLASKPDAVAAKAPQFVVFALGHEEYGIDIQKVRELRGYDTVTGIANAPQRCEPKSSQHGHHSQAWTTFIPKPGVSQ